LAYECWLFLKEASYMDFLKRIFRHGKSSTLLSGAFLALLGVICLGYTEDAVLGIVRLVGIVSLVLGITKFVDVFINKMKDPALVSAGVVEVVLGLILTLAPDAFIVIVFIILGVAVIGCGITAVEESKEGTGTHDKVVGICDIVLGAIMAIAPFAFINAIGIISGLALLVAGSTQILASMKMPEESFAKKR
jgi:uncharacterized membrane protein HdeD (DUF308 family)